MWQQVLTDILRYLTQAWQRMIDGSMLLTGIDQLGATLLLSILMIEVIVGFFCIPFHRYLLKRLVITKQLLVQHIDEIIYLLAKVQYESSISKRELGGDPHLAMMKELFKSSHFEYLDTIALIRENVGKVELLLEKQVVTSEQRAQITTLQKKLKRLIGWSTLLGIFCTLFTLGSYKLFR